MSTVSIIIPSYRQPQFLGRAIESCLEQDHSDLEVVVVDDHSRDASLGLALSWQQKDDRVRVIEAPRNGGLGRSRNIGIAQARGDFLCFLDSDDYLLPKSVSARIGAFPAAEAEHGGALAGVYGDWQHVGETVDHPVVRRARQNMSVVSSHSYTGENVFICSAPLVRRDRVLDAGGFPEGLKMLEDFGLWARMIASGAVFAPVRHVVATYRQRPNSMLRGDGVVSMADHVEVINRWMESQGTPLADGGALAAWMAGDVPFSHGRMSWNVPSILGSFGGAPGAASVRESSASEPVAVKDVPDFMTHPIVTGLDDPPGEINADDDLPDVALIARTLSDAVAGVAVAARIRTDGQRVGVFVPDPTDWITSWPLALDGLVPRALPELEGHDSSQIKVFELQDESLDGPPRSTLLIEGARCLWPDVETRSGVVVYVPDVLRDHPALDAWVSTVLHIVAEADLDMSLVADPTVRDGLGGWRSSFLTLDAVLGAEMVICPHGPHRDLIAALSPVVIFDPFVAGGEEMNTINELRSTVAQFSSSRR